MIALRNVCVLLKCDLIIVVVLAFTLGHLIKHLIICPIAIAYSMGQIIKSVSVCLSICLPVCEHSHVRIS